jgi:uncharacterized protein (TIGR03000 family)
MGPSLGFSFFSFGFGPWRAGTKGGSAMDRRYLGISAVALAGLLALAGYSTAQEQKQGSVPGQIREGAAAGTQKQGSGAAQPQQSSTTQQGSGEIRSGNEVQSADYYSGPYYYGGGRRFSRGNYYGPDYYSSGWRPRGYGYGFYDNGSYNRGGYVSGDSYYDDGSYGGRRRLFGRRGNDYSYGNSGPAYGYSSADCDSGTYYGSTANGYAYGATNSNTALIDVKLGAADAQVFFDDAATQQTGDRRQFTTPPLEPGKNFSYMVHAKWKQGDRDMDDNRKVAVHAGERVMVDFTVRQEEGAPGAPRPEGAPRPRLGEEGPPTAGARAPRPGEQADIDIHEGSFLNFRNGTLEMTDLQGQKHSSHLAPGAQIIINGQPAKVEDLKADMKLKVTTKKGDPQTITKIEVKSQGKQNGDKQAPPPQPKQNGEKQAPDKSQIPPPPQSKL